MGDPLFSASRMKLERAREFIGEVQHEEDAYKDSNPITAKIVWRPRPEIDIQWAAVGLRPGAIIGDAIHNMRTALDLMACEMARLNNKPDKNVYFPFAGSEGELDRQISERRFNLAGEDAVLLLKSFAPYKGGNLSLRAVHDLDVHDKHRALIPIASDMDIEFQASYDITGPSKNEWAKPILHSFSFKFPDETPFPGKPVVNTLEELVKVVEGVLESFACLVAARPS